MTGSIKYEILDSLPAYGPMYISITDDGLPFYSQGFVVRFFKLDGMDWVANFEPGWTDLNAVYEFENQPFILVIAGGLCYIMNPNEQKPISSFGIDYESLIKSPDERLILQSNTKLTVFELNGDYWSTERISFDGIKNLKLEGTIVSGLSYDPMNEANDWVEFVVDLETKKLSGGSYNQYEFTPLGPRVESVKKRR